MVFALETDCHKEVVAAIGTRGMLTLVAFRPGEGGEDASELAGRWRTGALQTTDAYLAGKPGLAQATGK